jgi:DUF438 domain-containing protein
MSELIDNRAHRLRALKQVVHGLHEGRPLAEVRAQLTALVRQCDAAEIASMEQELIADGFPVAQILGMCDLHSRAVADVLVDAQAQPPAGHPVDTFHRENQALHEQAARLRAALAALAAGPAEATPQASLVHEARRVYGLLMDVDKHYLRKEHLLFPFLEKRGITGPSTVMWAKDDEVRRMLKSLGAAFEGAELTAGEWDLLARGVAEPALVALEEMIFKEERILLPMSLQKLTEAEWGEIAAQSPRLGYCLVDPVAGWRPKGAEAASAPRSEAEPVVDAIVMPTGALTLAQLQSLFATLPVDLTFVDAEDRVRFFSEGRNRVFHRAKAVIGRKVQNCHPPASVGVVDRILADFRSGAQSVAEFWIQMRGRFVHIRYFALRDEAGAYLGTLEVTQDLTRERSLEGDRRLLQYES